MRKGMKTPEAVVYHNNLTEKLNNTKRSYLKMLSDVLKLHAPGGFGLCKVCVEYRADGARGSQYPCRTVRTIERRLK